jgi:AraC-like DNA-binding protein
MARDSVDAVSISRRRAPIPVPAPLASASLDRARISTVIDLPRLRWAARCRDRQFDKGCVAPHAHDEPELVFCTKGRITILVAGEAIEGHPGDLYVLPAGVLHAVASDGAWENVCVLCAGAEAQIDTRPRAIPLGATHRVGRWLADLCGLYDPRPEMPGPAADALLYAILTDVAEFERHRHRLRSFHPRLAAAVEYLQDRTGQHVSGDELARATRTSYSHLSALFRQRLNCGPLHYHRGQRIERAKNLLLDPYVSVGEVAGQLGFDDLSYFVRVFRKATGVPPNRWRKLRGGGLGSVAPSPI